MTNRTVRGTRRRRSAVNSECQQLCDLEPLQMLRHCTYSTGFAGLSPQKLGFIPGPVYVGFVVNKVAMVQVFLRALPCSPVIIIPPILRTHISCTYHRHDVILATVGIVKLHTKNYKEHVGVMTLCHLKVSAETTFEASYHIISYRITIPQQWIHPTWYSYSFPSSAVLHGVTVERTQKTGRN